MTIKVLKRASGIEVFLSETTIREACVKFALATVPELKGFLLDECSTLIRADGTMWITAIPCQPLREAQRSGDEL